MKKMMLAVLLTFVIFWSGCGSTRPQTRAELFPKKNTNPLLGLIIIKGEPTLNLEITDEATRKVQVWAEKGSAPYLTSYGKTPLRGYECEMPHKGKFKVIGDSFYYPSRIGTKRAPRWVKRNISKTITVDDDPQDYYDKRADKYYGWILEIDSGKIPPHGYTIPRVNVTGRGGPKILIDFLFGRRDTKIE